MSIEAKISESRESLNSKAESETSSTTERDAKKKRRRRANKRRRSETEHSRVDHTNHTTLRRSLRLNNRGAMAPKNSNTFLMEDAEERGSTSDQNSQIPPDEPVICGDLSSELTSHEVSDYEEECKKWRHELEEEEAHAKKDFERELLEREIERTKDMSRIELVRELVGMTLKYEKMLENVERGSGLSSSKEPSSQICD